MGAGIDPARLGRFGFDPREQDGQGGQRRHPLLQREPRVKPWQGENQTIRACWTREIVALERPRTSRGSRRR
jgi:hypothetical protein